MLDRYLLRELMIPLGYCLGGTLALEMARQLIASGETVGLLALIEIYNIRSISWPLSTSSIISGGVMPVSHRGRPKR
ncbi:MAG: thioesterase domain-containing protein [Bryobacteraceae bacterium]